MTNLGGLANTEQVLIIIQEKLDNLVEWSNKTALKINSMKCKVMFLGTNTKNFCYKMATERLGQWKTCT